MQGNSSQQTRYIFITGGVVSSLGKGIAAASLGRLLVERGMRVTIMKFDPYLNVDPGTILVITRGSSIGLSRKRTTSPPVASTST